MQVDLKNRKLLKEWAKIADADLFQSLEEFAEFYYAHGEKFCYKKFTNEEWSQENFFFGTYDELKEFYKTDTTIPFSAQQKAGKKFHSLTVIELFAENKTGKKVIYAKCKCDCGKDTIKILRDIVKGDVCTCGCRSGGKKLTVKNPLTEDTIKEFWDFDKNGGIDPYKISQTSTVKYWWRDKEGNSYRLAPYVFIKKETHSSFPEQALFYYIKAQYSSAINRANFITDDGEVLEIDIYIPAFNIGIEYDGVFWHKNKAESDTYKSIELSKNGVFLIRIRENGLPNLAVSDYIINQAPYSPMTKADLVITLNEVLKILSDITNHEKHPDITYQEFNDNRNSIYSLRYEKPVEENISDTCIGRFWDVEKNGALQPDTVSLDSDIPIFFKCSVGHSLQLSGKRYKEKFDKAKLIQSKLHFKYYNCYENYHSVQCLDIKCCPFSTLDLCRGGINCVYRSEENFPKILCLDKNITPGDYFNAKNGLRLCFMNKSTCVLDDCGTGAILISKSHITRIGNSSFFEQHPKNYMPLKHYPFNLCVNDKIKADIPNSNLIIYKHLFRTIKDNSGWFFYSFLIVDFDEDCNIIKSKSFLCSKSYGEKITNYSNSITEFKSYNEKIFSGGYMFF